MSGKSALMHPFQWDTSKKIAKNEEEIINALNDPTVHSYFANAEKIESDSNEDIRLICYPREENAKIIEFDIDESGTNENTASATINPDKIENKCPSDKYLKLWYHTHNETSSAPSELDQRSGQDIYGGVMGNTMCAVGINGASCLIQDGDDPLLIHAKWNDSYLDYVQKKYRNKLIKLPFIDDLGNPKQKPISTYDYIICYAFPDQKSSCKARNYGFEGIPELDLGDDIDSYNINGDSDSYFYEGGYSATIHTPFDGKFSCMKYKMKSGGRKLLCL